MTARRLIPLLAIAVAMPALPAAASARGLSVSLPKSITQNRSFAYTWEGDTGPTPEIGGGSIVRVIFVRGKKACPANAETSASTIAAVGGSDNVFHAGSFRGADQVYISTSGTVRVCGYISTPGTIETYEKLFTKTLRVKALPRRAKYDFNADRLKDGTYKAGPGDILGGTPESSLTFVVAKAVVVSVTATGIPNTACSASFPTQTPIAPTVTSSTPEFSPNRIIGESIGANFTAPTGNVSLQAGAKSSKAIHGSLTEDSVDGSCRGGFGFIAKRS